MRFIDVIRIATRNFRTNKLRTFLTVLAVSVATAAILFLVSFGYGLQLLTVQRIASSATISTVDVVPLSSKSLLKFDDAAAAKVKALPDVVTVSPELDIEGQAITSSSTASTVVHATHADYFELADVRPEIGALFAQSDSHKAVVSTGYLSQFGLAESQSTLGQQFHLNYVIPSPDETSSNTTLAKDDQPYTIAGILKDDDVSYIYVPLGDAQALVKGVQFANFKVQATDRNKVIEVKDAVNGLGFDASAPLDTLQQLNQVFTVVQITLGALGVIALIISSIGMFNTMTIALLERTREIGIMKALGANKIDIWKLFLAESSIIGFLGGTTGVIIGGGMALTANIVLNVLAGIYGGEKASIFYSPPWFVAAIIIFSTAVGAITGFYPARRASQLNPLKALRYE